MKTDILKAIDAVSLYPESRHLTHDFTDTDYPDPQHAKCCFLGGLGQQLASQMGGKLIHDLGKSYMIEVNGYCEYLSRVLNTHLSPDLQEEIVAMNDNENKTFKEIAKYVKQELKKVKPNDKSSKTPSK